ncbi:uncharacterized protein LOC111310811 [Durio zibethinus]|uniref:Uncharacterized protein LOC111310811 n=1 Tax=Durio zibethinus TaxID=66656 RepID=A0A6P6AM55_DURZI|nr:uncharacterized protein LOC111310811 [Durio zibethinus]
MCNSEDERKRLWMHLISLKSILESFPWMLAGDVNVVAHSSERKLDRGLINDIWLTQIPNSEVEFLLPEVSDHCPALIKLTTLRQSPQKPVMFFHFWVKHPEFLKLVEESWTVPVSGKLMVVLQKKLKRPKPMLRNFNFTQYGDLTKKVRMKKEELAAAQLATLMQSPKADAENERKLSLELFELLKAEESLGRQKSKIRWVGYFSQISDEAVGFFKQLMGTTDANVEGCKKELWTDLLQVSLTDKQRTAISQNVTREEIKEAIFT